MAAQATFAKINLVPQDEFEKSLVGKVLRWTLTAGKSIVVITEFVVILAFLSRFKLDRDLNDLNEVIEQKTLVVESYADTETQMRLLQTKAGVVGMMNREGVGVGKRWLELVELTPIDTRYKNIELGKNQVVLKGIAGSEAGFSQLLRSLSELNDIQSLESDEIEFDPEEGGVVFTITAKLANEKGLKDGDI